MPISGWVIAGGKSSRMGRDKALMEYDGKSMLANAIEKLRAVAKTVAICGGNPTFRTEDIPIIADPYQCGPLGGIVASLETTSTEWNLVLPVDMPLVPVDWLRNLLIQAQTGSAKAFVTRTEARPQPLVAAYHRDLAGALKECVLHQNHKVMNALTSVAEVAYLDSTDAASFVNVNTPDEYAALPKARFDQ